MELKEKLKFTIDKISKQNSQDYKRIWFLFLISVATAASTFFNCPVAVSSTIFIVTMIVTLKMFLRIQEGGRLKNKLISLMKDLEQ